MLACLLRLPVESARRSFWHEWNGWMLGGKNSGFAQQARQTGCLDAGMKGLLFEDTMPMGSSAALLLRCSRGLDSAKRSSLFLFSQSEHLKTNVWFANEKLPNRVGRCSPGSCPIR